jgi:hypothetical protein
LKKPRLVLMLKDPLPSTDFRPAEHSEAAIRIAGFPNAFTRLRRRPPFPLRSASKTPACKHPPAIQMLSCSLLEH